MFIANRVSKGFDSHVRRWRIRSALFMEISILIEVITPIFSNMYAFLCLASLANAGKNVCWLSTSATKAHINKHFCKFENLADVTGKAVSQAILASLCGTILGMSISLFTGAAGFYFF